MPSGIPPHRPPPIASAPRRLALLQVALRGQSRLILDARELARSGPSYTVDTLVELRADAFAGLPGWHGWRRLFELAHIGVLNRPGEQVSLPDELQRETADRWVEDPVALQSAPTGSLIALSVTSLEISATRIRQLLAAGREPRYQLPSGLFDEPELLAPYRR